MEKEMLLKLLSLLLEKESTPTAVTSNNPLWSENIWKYVILRWYNSWVHFWKLEYASPWLYRLIDSRRVWYWKCKQWIALSSVALYWLHSDSKICWTIPRIEIIDDKISEIIPCSQEAIISIQWLSEYNPN